MLTLYQKIEFLCKSSNTTISGMCREAGISRSALSELKAGRSESLSTKTLSKIADYFNITVDRLLSEEFYQENQKMPTPQKKVAHNADTIAKSPSEQKILLLARHLDKIPESAREKIIKNFEETIDLYLDAMNIDKGE